MSDTEKYLKRLELSNVLRTPVMKSVIDTIQLPPGSKGLDAGCGNGRFTLMLAEAVGYSGHVTGLDIEESFLTNGSALASQAGLAERISFTKGDVKKLPFNDNVFDWALSIDLVGYALLQVHPVMLLEELLRVVKPGGKIYILMWSSQMLLPGYPVLEARLNATTSGMAPFDKTKEPGLHFMRAPEWLQQAGLTEPKAKTFVRDLNSPINNETRQALIDLFFMRWGEDNPELLKEDQLEYKRLCRDESPECILNIPGYYGFFTYSLFQGRVADG